MGPMSHRAAGFLVVAALALGAAACSSDSSSSSSTTATSSSSTCADLDQVQQQFDTLKDTDVVADGTDALTSNLDSFRDSVSALADSASGDLKDEADSLKSSVDQLSSIIGSANDQPVTSTLTQFTQQLQTIGSDVTALLDSAKENLSQCDTGSSGGS